MVPLGELVFAFGHLEKQIDWSISILLNACEAPKSPTVASQIRNICSRVALVEALFRQHTSDERQRAILHDLVKELQAALKFRNGVLHGPWGSYDERRCVWRKPRTHAVDLSPWELEVSVDALQQHIQRANDIGNDLVMLVSSVAGSSPS